VIKYDAIVKYLKSVDVNDIRGSMDKFYVAVTRAEHSVAFLNAVSITLSVSNKRMLRID